MKKITLLLITLISLLSVNAKVYLRGSFNSWSTTNEIINGQVIVKLTANQTYEFKIEDNGIWYGNDGTMQSNQSLDWTFSSNANNAKIQTTVSGDYVFKWNSTNQKLTVTYPYCIAGTTDLTGKDWDAAAIVMTKDGDEYKHTFNNLKENGNYQFKITQGNWNWSIGYDNRNSSNDVTVNNSDGNIKFELSNPADVKIILSSDVKISIQLYYDVTVTAGTGGTVSGGGENIRHNTNTKITATPSTGYHFVQWSDGDKNASREITVTKNATYTATFAINTYEVTVETKEGGTGTGTGTYNHGATATLTATPEAGYEFVKWNDGNTDNPRTITNITSNQSYTATFSRKDRTFSDPSELDFGTYGKLTYQLSMPSDQWYWISLPFKVNIDEITTSTGNGAKDLVITYYDAKIRAENGKGGWMNAKEQKLTTLTANQGYVIGFYTDENTLFPANGVTVNFPSASTTNTVADSANLATTEAIGKNEKDNNWHIIGTGLYRQGSLSNINYVAMPAKNDKGEDTYEYKYISSGNELFTEKIGANSFDPFTAFFVQYGGEYSATAETTKSAALAPVARAKAQEQEQIYLINMNEAHTVVILNAEGSEGYTASEDFLEMNASNHSDLIYSFDGSDALAFNHRATEAQSINLGGYVATAGEQTISLKGYNANVESVTLVDNVTGETIELLTDNYTFTAEVGSLDGRFTVVFGAPKAGDTTVDCYNSTANQLIAYGSANACTVSGLTTGEAVVVYNAMGQLVFATIADSETITLPTLPTGNYLILHNGTTNKTLLK